MTKESKSDVCGKIFWFDIINNSEAIKVTLNILWLKPGIFGKLINPSLKAGVNTIKKKKWTLVQ